MKDTSVQTVIQNYFDQHHKSKTILSIEVQEVSEEYKTMHPNAKFQVEVVVAYSVQPILQNLGYTKEAIAKNMHNDSWLQTIERKHGLIKQTLVNPTQYYLFVEASEKYHNEKTWNSFYNNLLAKTKGENALSSQTAKPQNGLCK